MNRNTAANVLDLVDYAIVDCKNVTSKQLK